MIEPQWEEVETPRGAYIGFGSQTGQHVTGKVLSYSDAGGTNFAGDPCPQLSIELTDKAASFNKQGDRTDFPAGELVVINAGQANLSRGLRSAALEAGYLVKIELVDFAKTANGQAKIFTIKIDKRGAGTKATPAAEASAEIPF